jgi:YegS/Rv2252/BmrU family lipid kinase
VLTKEAIREGYEHIFSVGGDGTFHEVLNGYLENDKPMNPNVILSLLPAGTGGDLRRSLELPRQIEPALRKILSSPLRKLDCGKCECVDLNGNSKTEYFHNVCSLGLTDLAAEVVNASPNLKKLGGTMAFLLSGIQAIVKHKPPKVQIVVDSLELGEFSVNVMAIANGSYFGGGMKIAPYAKMDDGLFDVLLFTDLSRPELLAYNGLIYSGSHLKIDKVKQMTGSVIQLKSEEQSIRIEADGEILGKLPATCSVLPKAVLFQ